MQTSFGPAQLADPATAVAEAVIRKCVHCGFCTATCPTYVLLGDELDSPRGRIYLIKDMLETEAVPTPTIVKHVDRCLSCLACMTTCPSGVNYMHLVDHARSYIEHHYRRPVTERLLRLLLAKTLPYPPRFRLALRLARWVQPLAPRVDRMTALKPLAAMLALAPRRLPPAAPTASPAVAGRRVLLLQGCAEPVLRPEIRAATLRVLERAGCAAVFAKGEGCCGALVHHLGREHDSLDAVRRNLDAWRFEIERGLEAIVVTASGCGTQLKEYGFLMRDEPAYAAVADRASALARDISELLVDPALAGRLRAERTPSLKIAYHGACSLQHGQRVTQAPVELLERAGFTVAKPDEAHLCCGSAGTYNLLQPDLAGALGSRKAERLEALRPDVIATGNIGCLVQLSRYSTVPVVHLVELLDWASGGPAPAGIGEFFSEA